MTTYYTYTDKSVELREVAGEMNSILSNGSVTVSGQKKIKVGDSSFSFTTFRKMDSRTYVCATPDYMTSYYVTFPKDTDASVTFELDQVLTALVDGKDPNLEKTESPAGPANAESRKEGSVDPAVQQAAGFLGAVWNAGTGMAMKAGETAQKASSEAMKKAQEDTKTVMDGIHGKKNTAAGDKAMSAGGLAPATENT